ncbi:MAG TPA: hypothetical protein VK168_17070 [Saprospiraceae bacterium]|nr:hypothetical protein [Saprospiraceae bacterium]
MKSKSKKTTQWQIVPLLKKLRSPAEKIGFTTLGILLALWINNLDEKRKKREIEQKTLLEIKAGLMQDRKDLQETIQGYDYRVYNTTALFQYLSQTQIPRDSLAYRITNLVGYSFLLANTAAYETLKSRGLETITNDSLRLGITTLYDVEYEAIQTSEMHLSEVYNNMLLPYLVQNMPLGVSEVSPVELQKILKDRPFQQMLWQIRSLNESTMGRYTSALQGLETQLSQIEKELNSGRF